MKKDIEAMVAYWRNPGDGSLPDKENDKEILLGHHDEIQKRMLIRDIRGTESDYFLDTHGFQVHTLPRKERIVTDVNVIKTEYFEEIATTIKKLTNAREVIVFGHVIRQLPRDSLKAKDYTPGQVQAPSPKAHVDFSPTNIKLSLSRLVPQASSLIHSHSRWQVLGVWRPLKTIARDPLILADARSVPAADYRDLSRQKTIGQDTYVTVLTYGEGVEHRWHYLSDMEPEELLVFKHYDSKRDVDAWRCGHTSVAVRGTEELPARESIEVRVLVGH